jgi:hypothetical protein
MARNFGWLVAVLMAVGFAGGCEEDVNTGDEYDCLAHWDCSGETLCLDRACVDAYDRYYIVDNFTANVVSTDAGWDALGGAPDLFVCVLLDGETLGCSATIDNRFTGSWSDAWQFVPMAGSELVVELFDYDDVSDSEPIIICRGEVTLDMLRSDGEPFACQSGLGDTVAFSVSPK